MPLYFVLKLAACVISMYIYIFFFHARLTVYCEFLSICRYFWRRQSSQRPIKKRFEMLSLCENDSALNDYIVE